MNTPKVQSLARLNQNSFEPNTAAQRLGRLMMYWISASLILLMLSPFEVVVFSHKNEELKFLT